MSRPCILAIDAGSTGVRALVFDRHGAAVGGASQPIASSFPQPGRVEQDGLEIWGAVRAVVANALQSSGLAPNALAAVGITNQRATVLVWNAQSGRPIAPAISWQDVRTAARVEAVLQAGIYTNTMASATKIEWILQHAGVDGRIADLRCGTIDTWLAWHLTGGRVHVTDPSNASCTGLYNFATGDWDDAVLAHLGVPRGLLPAIRPSSERYAATDAGVFGAAVPLASLAGDQQAALFGELGVEIGAAKITLGTAGMIDIHTGPVPVLSQRGAYPLALWTLGEPGGFCLEGTIVTAGAVVQWLRDVLGVIRTVEESGPLAASVPDSGGVWVVPALQGLGTPYLEPAGRAVIGGLSRGTTRAHIVRAALEGIAFRAREVLETLSEDAQLAPPAVLRADGGAAANDTLLQCLANALGRPVERPATVQASALGAAYLAGLAVGVWSGIDALRGAWRSGGLFTPAWSDAEREERFVAWRRTVAAARIGAGRERA